MSWVVWITGLPGCGKSTVASSVKKILPETEILRMDELRKVVTPHPTYSDEEREYVYRSLVYTAEVLCRLGHDVIIDATGNRRSWRNFARERFPDFFEVYIKCPLELCKERESKRLNAHAAPANIYKKSKTGAPVPGINVPYEEPENPELVIDAEKESPGEAAKKIAELVSQ